MSSLPAKMHCVKVEKVGGEFEYVERPLPVPKPNEVLIKVEACGVCHSDSFVKVGMMASYPRIPGHEVIGTVVKVGDQVKRYKVGDRVGRGWHGSHCFECDNCFRGDFTMCQNTMSCGITNDGGYAEYMTAPWESLAHVPAGMCPAQAGPLMCAGVTVFNAMRNQHVLPGAVVAIQGIGGLGHLAVQFARAMGYHVVALSSGSDKKELAAKLGAHVYVDSGSQDVVAELKKLGGAKMILVTAPAAKAVSKLVDGLAPDGKVVFVGASMDPLDVNAVQLLMGRRAVSGWASGSACDSEDTLRFAALHGVHTMVEAFPLSQATVAYDKMMTNKARFRAVLVPDAVLATCHAKTAAPCCGGSCGAGGAKCPLGN